MSHIENLIRREISRAWARFNHEMVGYIDSYKPQDHTAKVKFPTELDAQGNPRISGWLPFKATAGSKTGISWVIGPQIGDQCTVSHLEGDSESGVITGFLHNVTDTPPSAASGQAILQHNTTGNFFTINTDGSMQYVHKATGNYVKVDASGNITANIKSGTQHYIGGDPALGHTMSPLATVAGPSPFAQARIS